MAEATRRYSGLQRRRQFLLRTLSGIAAVCGFHASFRAHAQMDTNVADAIEQIEYSRKIVEDLLHEVIYANVPLSREFINRVSAIDEESRSRLALVLRSLPLESQLDLVHDEYRPLALMMAEHEDVELVPIEEDITATDFEALSDAAEVHQCDYYRAILFIIFDALGFREHRDLVVELVRGTAVQALLEDLVDGYPEKSWEEIVRQTTDTVMLVASFEFVLHIRRVMGERAVVNILRQTGRYFVPYVGPIYLVVVVCAAVKKNWNLLVC